uniref:Virulence associated protein C n=1 Tax=Rhodococcus hoagii TaxID=43767 RepID=W5QKW7_RHOHA|nr:virulence associated protein C [Prescottella equi]
MFRVGRPSKSIAVVASVLCFLALGGTARANVVAPSAWGGAQSAADKEGEGVTLGGVGVPRPHNKDADEQYTVHGVVVSALFYNHLRISVDGGMTFDGDGGGLSTPGGGALWGTLTTSDLQQLYDETASFECNAVGPYLNINFYDSYGRILASVQAGGVSTMIGIGGGNGRWHLV